MDTITQALLGGTVAYVVAGKKHSARKTIAWGAAIAVLPDLDVLIPYENDLESITHHRSWSHSWFIQTLLAPFLSGLIHRFDQTFTKSTWFLLVWLALITHSALDALTVYGTQLFWPLMPTPHSGGSIFIIDPIYSLLLLLGIVVVIAKPNTNYSQKTLVFSFTLSCLYLIWGLMMQAWVIQQSKVSLAEQNINSDTILVSATPLNTVLWRVLAINDDHYYQGFISIFDNNKKLQFSKYDRKLDLITQADNIPALPRLNWFTSGFYALEKNITLLLLKI